MSNDTPEAAPRLRLEDLHPKLKLTGTVKKIELFGAFVDVGAECDGLVHISALSPRRVNKVEEIAQEGDTVTVWVRKLDAEKMRLDLTMIEPPALEWAEIKPNMLVGGKVVKIEKFGAFVDIGAERPGLVHISELADYRVENVTEVVKEGDEIEVRVLAVDPRKKQIKLSLKAASEMVEATDETEEPALTAMQAAFQRATSGATARTTAGRRSRAKMPVRDEQEDILNRTLANRRK